MDKQILLQTFRNKADEFVVMLNKTKQNSDKKASEINKLIISYRNKMIETVLDKGFKDKGVLNIILLITYASNVVMLEYRNKFRPYEYMDFTRRIGEIWEPFCKLPFYYPTKELRLFEPPTFSDIHKTIQDKSYSVIESLKISQDEKEELLKLYNDMWILIDSGNVNLKLDLHFEQDGVFYDVDYKSGFSSNEKGNTNRLLQVASIYNAFFDNHKNLIFVRQPEEENNHYFQTLKNSPFWDVYCADDAYDIITHFTGLNLRKWMDSNMDWVNDISIEFRDYLHHNRLLKYLTW